MPADTMRERFVTVSTQLLDEYPNVAVVVADISAALFRDNGAIERHPDRVINVGIREQLLVSVGGGLALEGIRPIVHTYAPFLVQRPYEQVKLDLAHQEVGAILVSVGASYDSAASGRTHQAPEDVALISTLPDWKIHVPGHPDEAETYLRSAAASSENVYIRLADDSNQSASVSTEAFAVMRRGSPEAATVIAVGPTLDRVIEATGGMDVTVLYASTVRPFDGETLRSTLGAPDVVLVEPYQAGTSSGEVANALRDVPHRVLGLGVQKGEHRHYGTRQEHDVAHGLDVQGLTRSVSEFVSRPVSV